VLVGPLVVRVEVADRHQYTMLQLDQMQDLLVVEMGVDREHLQQMEDLTVAEMLVVHLPLTEAAII
jgi:hypothetical protein